MKNSFIQPEHVDVIIFAFRIKREINVIPLPFFQRCKKDLNILHFYDSLGKPASCIESNDITSSEGIFFLWLKWKRQTANNKTSLKGQRNKMSKGSWKEHLLCFCVFSCFSLQRRAQRHVLENGKLKKCTRRKKMFCRFLGDTRKTEQREKQQCEIFAVPWP